MLSGLRKGLRSGPPKIGLPALMRDERGFSAVLTGLCATVIFGAVGLAVDVGYWQLAQRQLQAAADQAAYAAALTANGAQDSSTVAKAQVAAEGIVAQTVGGGTSFATCGGTPSSSSPCSLTNCTAKSTSNNLAICVNNPPWSGSSSTSAWQVLVSQSQPLWFSSLYLSSSTTTTTASAAAAQVTSGGGSGKACALALDLSAQDAFLVSGSGVANMSNCDVVVKSSNSKAMETTGSGGFAAKDLYVDGGDNPNGSGGFTVTGTTQTNINNQSSSLFTDPYASRTEPSDTTCGSNPTSSAGGGSASAYTSPSTATTIYPGVYCGGLTAGGPLTLSPGVYTILNGGLTVSGGATSDPTLSGGVCSSASNKPYINATGGVTVYLTGSGSNGKLAVSSCLAITAPTTSQVSSGTAWAAQYKSSWGNTAGIAIWVDNSVGNSQIDSITGGGKVAIIGAIYDPNRLIQYNGSSIATTSCTQLVAKKIQFTGTANFSRDGCTSNQGVGDPTLPGGGSTSVSLVN